MKSKAKKVLILAVIVFVFAGGLMNTGTMVEENDIVFKMALYYNGCLGPSYYPTYYFILDEDNYLYCYLGKRREELVPFNNQGFLVRVKKSGRKLLSVQEIKMLMDLANHIDLNGNTPQISGTGFMEVDFYYKGVDYIDEYINDPPNGKLSELMNELEKLSLIPVSFDLSTADFYWLRF